MGISLGFGANLNIHNRNNFSKLKRQSDSVWTPKVSIPNIVTLTNNMEVCNNVTQSGAKNFISLVNALTPAV